MNTKDLLLQQTHQAFSGGEMSLKASLQGLSQQAESWRPSPGAATIEEILYHVAKCKIEYCKQGFAKWEGDYDRPLGEIDKMLELLDRAQAHMAECLEACTHEQLAGPIATQFHGESAAHFFSVMITHDLWHGSQMDMIRRAHDPSAKKYPYGPMADGR